MAKDDAVNIKGIVKMLNSSAISKEGLEIDGFRPTHSCASLGPDNHGEDVVICGWVQDIRNLGGVAFLILRDGTGTVQITLLREKLGSKFKKVTKLNRESVIGVKGTVNRTEQTARGFEILASEIRIFSKAQSPLPMGVVDKVNVELDTRLDHRFMDLRREETQAIFRIRHLFLRAVRQYLEDLGFIELHTPKIVAAATEGGTDLFPAKYFEKDAYLNQSPQLYKQILMATGFDRVYEIGPAFRAEPHDTVRHLNEFTSIDIEAAYHDDDAVMDILEGIVKHASRYIEETGGVYLSRLGISLPDYNYSFPRIEYDEVIDLLQGRGVEIEWGQDIGMAEIKTLVESDDRFRGYYFITRWPTEAKPFYAMPVLERPEVSRTFDLMYAEKEITSGAQRVHDYNLLVEQLKAHKLKPKDFEFYLEAFRYGMPPHGGFGLGTERMVMILTHRSNIRECVLFPRDRNRLIP